MSRRRTVILGAAGRDFHVFNTVFRDDPSREVVAFTAAQIPGIAGRCYPAGLAGPLYPGGIPILPEEGLQQTLSRLAAEEVVFAYSDVTHAHVMHLASEALAAGADVRLCGPRATMLASRLPVVAVCAVRTGSGKSLVSREVAAFFRARGVRVVVIRHPMPYGDLAAQAVQRFAALADLDAARCTVEEREEYEPHIAAGSTVFSGVDMARVLAAAEAEAELILWDGGNNDFPFYVSDLKIVVADPHRPGHESTYHPGETNARDADVIVINKVDTADPQAVIKVRENLRALNPTATVIEAASPLFVDDPSAIQGKRVLVIEDGPTLTHGEMAYGAGYVAAQRFGAKEIVDPRPFAVKSIAETYKKYPKTGPILPAMGYGRQQMKDLEATIKKADVDLVIVGTPIDLTRVIKLDKPYQRVRYELQEIGQPTLEDILKAKFGKQK